MNFLLGFFIHFCFGENLVCFEDECDFELILRYRFTMSCKANNGDWYPIEVVENDDNTFTINATTNEFYPNKTELTAMNLQFQEQNCIFGDGVRTSIIAINDQFPGPTIEVRQGAKIHFTVINKLRSTSATIHWHGFEMRHGFYWYDGAHKITQCGIDPGQTFTYTFIADEPGTRWYHGQLGGIQADGVHGAILVHNDEELARRTQLTNSNVLVLGDITHKKIHKGGSAQWLSSSAYKEMVIGIVKVKI